MLTPDYLSAEEAAEYAGVTLRTIRKWASQGRLGRFAGPTGRPIYRKDQLDALLIHNKRLPLDQAAPPLPPPGTMHEAAAAAQHHGDPQLARLLDRALTSTAHAEQALTQALEEIRWLKARVEEAERERAAAAQERADLHRLLLAHRLLALPQPESHPGGAPTHPPPTHQPADESRREGRIRRFLRRLRR